jgi:hypothetical protein
VRHVVAWLITWVVLWWLWQLLTGEWNHYEWIAGACAATIAATIGEIARTRAGVRAHVPLRRLGTGWSALPQVVADFGIITWALVRSALQREVVRGAFITREFPAGRGDPESVGVRTWVTVLADYSPNAYVIDIDTEKKQVLLHDLVPHRKSEQPA